MPLRDQYSVKYTKLGDYVIYNNLTKLAVARQLTPEAVGKVMVDHLNRIYHTTFRNPEKEKQWYNLFYQMAIEAKEGSHPELRSVTPPKPQLRQEQICVFNVIRDLEFSYKQPVAYQEVRRMGFSKCRLVEDRLKSVLKSLIDVNYVKSTPQHRLYINYEAQNKPVQNLEIKNKRDEYVPGSGRLF